MTSDPNRLTGGGLLSGLVKLSLPMLVSASLHNAQSLIDLFWVSRLGPASVAALAMSGTVLMMLFTVLMGMGTGTVALVSRAVGAGDRREASRVVEHSLALALGAGVATGAVGWWAGAALCRLLGAGPEVAVQGTAYLQINFAACFVIFVLFIGNSALQGAGNTVIPMCSMMLANAINIVLDPVLIFGWLGVPALGIRGAALATVVSHVAAAGLTLGFLFSGRVAGIRARSLDLPLRFGLIWRLVRVGVPSSGQMLARSAMGVVLMRIVASCGTAAVAAYGIGLRVHMIILMPAFVLGNAAATMVGQNLGAGRRDRAGRAAWLAVALDAGFMVVTAGAVTAAAPALMGWFSSSPDVIAIGTNFLRIVSPFFIFAALSIVLGRSLQGASDTVSPMLCTVFSLWVLQVPLAVGLSRVLVPPTRGIWWAAAIAITVHGLLVTAWFRRGRWKHRKV